MGLASMTMAVACTGAHQGAAQSAQSGGTPSPHATESVRLALFSSYGVRFSYPAAWTARHFDVVSTFTTSIVFLSTQRLTKPCRMTFEQRGRTISCGEPLGWLSDGGVLVQWMSF